MPIAAIKSPLNHLIQRLRDTGCTFGKTYGINFTSSSSRSFVLQLIQSMRYLFNLIIQNILESRPQFRRPSCGFPFSLKECDNGLTKST